MLGRQRGGFAVLKRDLEGSAGENDERIAELGGESAKARGEV